MLDVIIPRAILCFFVDPGNSGIGEEWFLEPTRLLNRQNDFWTITFRQCSRLKILAIRLISSSMSLRNHFQSEDIFINFWSNLEDDLTIWVKVLTTLPSDQV